LKFEHLSTGLYEARDSFFPNLPYLQVGGQLQQKTRKLSVSHDTFLTDRDARRVVHNPNDVLSPFGLFSIIRKKAHPDQEYVFCHQISTANCDLMASFDERFTSVQFDPRKRMGFSVIGNFAKVLNERCRIPDWQSYTNHCWRTWMVTRLANDSAVSSQESLSFARHESATSQLPYVRRGENSRASFQKAIQTVNYPSNQNLKKKTDTVAKKGRRAKSCPPTKSCQSSGVGKFGDKSNKSVPARMTTRSVSKK
jgi:hypothetical protein